MTRSLGYQTSLALARAGAKVYIAAQSRGKAEESIQEINKVLDGKGNLVFLELKLQSIAGAEAASRTFLELESRLDIIVANAGIHSKNELSIDGIEMCMAVNASISSLMPHLLFLTNKQHVGHQAFIMKLLPTMMRTSKDYSVATHISVTSSHSHFDIQHPDRDFDFSMFTNTKTITSGKFMDFNIRYARSKLANNLFAKHLSHLLTMPEYVGQGGNNVYVNIAHPGFINTDIQGAIADASNKVFGTVTAWVGRTFGITPAEGALTQLFLVTSERIEKEGIRGRYFVPIAKE